MDIKGGISTPVDSGAYTDVNRLASLKHGDKDSVANQKKVAQEFESLFVSQMLKAMRSANEVLAKDNPMNTAATRQYQDMYDQQLAVTLSTRGNGIGLQDVLMRQLSKDKGIKHAAPTDQAATIADPGAFQDRSGDQRLSASAVGHPFGGCRSGGCGCFGVR